MLTYSIIIAFRDTEEKYHSVFTMYGLCYCYKGAHSIVEYSVEFLSDPEFTCYVNVVMLKAYLTGSWLPPKSFSEKVPRLLFH